MYIEMHAFVVLHAHVAVLVQYLAVGDVEHRYPARKRSARKKKNWEGWKLLLLFLIGSSKVPDTHLGFFSVAFSNRYQIRRHIMIIPGILGAGGAFSSKVKPLLTAVKKSCSHSRLWYQYSWPQICHRTNATYHWPSSILTETASSIPPLVVCPLTLFMLRTAPGNLRLNPLC